MCLWRAMLVTPMGWLAHPALWHARILRYDLPQPPGSPAQVVGRLARAPRHCNTPNALSILCCFAGQHIRLRDEADKIDELFAILLAATYAYYTGAIGQFDHLNR